jgi:hypothetical protein
MWLFEEDSVHHFHHLIVIFYMLYLSSKYLWPLCEDKLYDLCPSFVSAINRGEIKDTDMEAIMDTIVDSLFSVFATLGMYFV